MDHAYADVNGVRLHYVTTGRGPLVLFLHGFPEFWYAWTAQLAEFGRDHRAVAPDMRGYNLSSKPTDLAAYRVKHLVTDVRALADHLGATTFALVGHDWGGVVAWAFALAHPDRLEQLVVVNAPHPTIFERELVENPAQLERFVDDLTIERVPDGSHWVIHEQPALVNRLIRQFLAGQPAR